MTTTLEQDMHALAHRAREACRILAESSAEARNAALRAAARAVRDRRTEILAANADDLANGRRNGLSDALLDRLALDEARLEGIAKGLEDIADLPDPLGRTLAEWTRPNGLRIARVAVPLGVIGIIYESRPNVTADAGGLCLKSGNAAILRGGSESFASSQAIAQCLGIGLRAAGLPEAAVQLVPTRDRDAVGAMLAMTGLIDVIVPRGGRSLTERVMRDSRVPTLLHLDGNCHTYLHASADPAMAEAVVVNAKLRRTGICGATESLVIDRALLASVWPRVARALLDKGCEIRADEAARTADTRIAAADEDDWDREYLDTIVSAKTVDGLDEAVAHINAHGSHHTDAIITADDAAAAQFLARIDSAIVVHNASTQFADGGEFGMGAEIGIATGRLHARGPVGAEQLTTYKYRVYGSGQCRA